MYVKYHHPATIDGETTIWTIRLVRCDGAIISNTHLVCLSNGYEVASIPIVRVIEITARPC